METDFITWAREVKGMRGALPDTPENRQKLQVLQSEFEQSRRAPAPSASVFDDLPETSMTANPQLPAVAQEPDSLSSLIPESNVFEELPAEEPAPRAPVAQGDMLRSVSEQRVLPVLQQWRQKFNEEIINGNHKTGVARAQKELDFNNRVVPQLVDLRSQGLLPPEVESVLTRYQEKPSGFPLVESLTMAYDDFISGRQRTPQGETGTAKDEPRSLSTPDAIKKFIDVYGADHPVTQMAMNKGSLETTKQLVSSTLSTPGMVRDLANKSVDYINSGDPVAATGASELVTQTYREFRNADDQRIGILRQMLGDKAEGETDLLKLEQSLDDKQSQQYAEMLRSNGITTAPPEAIPIITGGDNALSADENWFRVQRAAHTGAMLVEYGADKKGNPTAASARFGGGDDAKLLDEYSKRFFPTDGGDKPSRGEREQKLLNDPDADVLDQLEVLSSMEKKETAGKYFRSAAAQMMGGAGAGVDAYLGDESGNKERISTRAQLNREISENKQRADAIRRKLFRGKERRPGIPDAIFNKAQVELDEIEAKLNELRNRQ